MNRRNVTISPSFVTQQGVSSKVVASQKKSVKSAIVLFVIVVLMALVYVGIRIDTVHIGYKYTSLKKEVNDLMEEKNILESQVSRLKSPSRLEKIAKTELGMRLPLGDEIVVINNEESVNKGLEKDNGAN